MAFQVFIFKADNVRMSTSNFNISTLIYTQVLATAATIGLFLHFVTGMSGPAALVIGNGLALSSTAVVLQVSNTHFLEHFVP